LFDLNSRCYKSDIRTHSEGRNFLDKKNRCYSTECSDKALFIIIGTENDNYKVTCEFGKDEQV